jgi:leucyl aminopeptidase (aminopeptidase T)
MVPGITVDMMERLINIDFSEMEAFTQTVIQTMEDAEGVVIENPDGTYLECSVKGRKWKADNGDISQNQISFLGRKGFVYKTAEFPP